MLATLGACGGSGDGDTRTAEECSAYPAAATSPHILPWTVGHRYVARPHIARNAPPIYAIDVPMPIGTEILAIRAGVVIGVNESNVDGDNQPGHENWVFVRHEDNSIGAYIHLTNLGALVAEGDTVAQGSVIGLSGHTGDSTEPHLHFDVRPSCAGQPCPTLPAESVPLNFRNAQPQSGDLTCGLRNGVAYTALAF
jgi:murein DD-endopeptidase MepM/ murein hydrolase activator NlpD